MNQRNITIILAVLLAGLAGAAGGSWWVGRGTLAPIIAVEVDEAGLAFTARLDTGAVVSSINAEGVTVMGGGPIPAASDVGKLASFVLVNERGERKTLTAPIAQVRGIRMADCREVRYHVYLTVRHRGRAHRILTNLNDRSRATEKLLLGRNWLQHGYAVAPVEEAEI